MFSTSSDWVDKQTMRNAKRQVTWKCIYRTQLARTTQCANLGASSRENRTKVCLFFFLLSRKLTNRKDIRQLAHGCFVPYVTVKSWVKRKFDSCTVWKRVQKQWRLAHFLSFARTKVSLSTTSPTEPTYKNGVHHLFRITNSQKSVSFLVLCYCVSPYTGQQGIVRLD